MDAIGESINREFDLGMTHQHIHEIDLLYRDFMREYCFPISPPLNAKALKHKYLKKAILTFNPEQLAKYREKKEKEKRKKRTTRRSEGNDIAFKKHISHKYQTLNLSASQLDAFKDIIVDCYKQKLPPKKTNEVLLEKTKDVISTQQTHLLSELIKSENDRNLKLSQHVSNRKLNRIRREFNYLNLKTEQLEEISEMIEEAETDPAKSRNMMSYNRYPFKSNTELKSIFTEEQFKKYELHQQAKRTTEHKNRLAKDNDKQEEYDELKEWETFIIENILNERCLLLDKILAKASAEDLDKIEGLKEAYSKKIDLAISESEKSHKERNLTILPNQLKLAKSTIALNLINPSALYIKDEIDLTQNIFQTIELDENHSEILHKIRLKIREYNIKKFESKIKSYGNMASIIPLQQKVQPFEYLYSLILLDTDPKKNIDKKEKAIAKISNP